MIEGPARGCKHRKVSPVQVLLQRTLKLMMWTGTVSVILQLSVSNSQKIATVSWTSRISLNTSKKLGLAVDDRNTDKMASVPVGDTEGPVTGVIIEDLIRGVTGAGRNMGNTGDLAGESDAHGSGLNNMRHVVTLYVY